MIYHDLKLIGVAAVTVWSLVAAVDSLIEQIPAYALGAVGFAALVWRLLKDNTADSYIRNSYKGLIEAERARAVAAEKHVAELEAQIRRLLGDDPQEEHR